MKVGSEAIDFDQIRAGDQLKVTVTQELVVEMAGPGDTDKGAALVALVPKGAKPGGLIAQAVQLTGTITALDTVKRKASLRFEDARSKPCR